jgi:hypothetical protein
MNNKDLLIKEEIEKIDNLLFTDDDNTYVELVDMEYIDFIKLIESSLPRAFEEWRKDGISDGIDIQSGLL